MSSSSFLWDRCRNNLNYSNNHATRHVFEYRLFESDYCIWVRLLISKGARNLSYQACLLKVYRHTQLGARFNKVKLLILQFRRATFLLSASWCFSSLWNACLKAKHFQRLDDAMGLTPVQADTVSPPGFCWHHTGTHSRI